MIEVRKLSPSKQAHTVDGGKAIIDQHGYLVKITIDLDYNRLTNRQIPHAHNRIHALVDEVLATAFALRGSNEALIDVDDLELPLEMDADHA